MVNDEILYIRRRLKKKMDEDRFEHTIGVAYTSVCLAMRYGEDLHKAELAGLLHDCAKCIPDDIKLDKCKRNNIPITKAQAHLFFMQSLALLLQLTIIGLKIRIF